MKQLLIILSLIAMPYMAFATAQAADIIIYKGKSYLLYSNPLEQYLDAKSERKLNEYEFDMFSTGCYRGYRATWELIEDSLYLISVSKGCHGKDVEYLNLEKEFGVKKVYAYWFTGTIDVVLGKRLLYQHMGYASIFEYEVLIDLDNGVMKNFKVCDNTKTYKSIYTEDFEKFNDFVYSTIQWDKLPKLKDGEEVKAYVKITSGASSQSFKVEMLRETDFPDLNKEILKVVTQLPEWDVYYKFGKPYEMAFAVPIKFSESLREIYSSK